MAAPPRSKRLDPSMSISPSQLDSMDCRLKWYWAYNLGYRSKIRDESLTLGTGVHKGLEAKYLAMQHGKQEASWPAFLQWADEEIARTNPQWPDELRKMKDVRVLGEAMLRGYDRHYAGKDAFDVIATEHTISRPLPDPRTGEPSPYHVTVRLDGIIRDHQTKRLMVLEHKTYKRIETSHFSRDTQFTLEVWCGQYLSETLGLDEEVIGVLYNGLRSQAPGDRVTVPLFERHPIMRTPHQIEVALHRAFWQKHEFAQQGLVIYPQPQQMKCGRCDFKGEMGPCEAYMRGDDYKQILGELYTRRGDGPRPAQMNGSRQESGVSDASHLTGKPVEGAGEVRTSPDASKRSLRERMATR